jgi:hypothetical protein
MPDRGSRLKLLAALGGSLTRAANRDRRIRAPGTPGPVLAPKQCPDRGPACGLLRGCQEPLRKAQDSRKQLLRPVAVLPMPGLPSHQMVRGWFTDGPE